MVPAVLLLSACLEEVTGEDVPLDCRFYGCKEQGAGVGPEGGDGQPQGPAGGGEAPWSGVEGEKRKLVGTLIADEEYEIQIDVNEPDTAAPGGQRRVGALHTPPGSFELEVPLSVKAFRIEAFQDPDGDGPSPMDPYAEATVDLSGELPALSLTLTAGARGQASATAAPPGAPGGPGQGGQPTQPDPFGDVEKVRVSGTVTAPTDKPVKVDLFKLDPNVAGGRTFLVNAQPQGGAWSFDVPRGFGPIDLEAYQDLDNDGPSATDPKGRLVPPISVGEAPIEGVVIEIR